MEAKNDFSFKIAALTVIKRGNKFLLIRRSNLETMSGVWEFPAGKLEFSENLEQCAIRETEEETSIKVKKLKSIGYHERYDKEKIDHVIFHDFFAVDFEGKVKLSWEHDDYKWITKEEILDFDNVGIDTLIVLKKLKE